MSAVEEPAWWQHARALEAQGLSRYAIAKAIGLRHGAVRYALDPEYRARAKARTLAWIKANPPQERYTDHKRSWKRRTARQRWRDGGCVGTLHDAYVRAGCQ